MTIMSKKTSTSYYIGYNIIFILYYICNYIIIYNYNGIITVNYKKAIITCKIL